MGDARQKLLRFVGDDQHSPIFSEGDQQIEHALLHRPIQAGGGFIEQEHFRVAQQLGRQGEAPLLAAAELLGHGGEGQIGEAHPGQHGLEGLGGAVPLAEAQVLPHGEAQKVALGKLKDEATEPAPLAGRQELALPANAAPIWIGQAADHLQQGGFATAAAAGHQGGCPGRQAQVDVAQHRLGGGGGVVADRLKLKHAASLPPGRGMGWQPEADRAGAAVDVRFRELDPFNCWFWLRFAHPPGQGERAYVETAFDSWFYLGKLGGFNAESLQAHDAGADLSWLAWEEETAEQALPALMHNMGVMEYQGVWGRCWLDLGTSDGFALDVLINTLRQIDRDVVELCELVIGGRNEDWPIEEEPEGLFAGDGGLPAGLPPGRPPGLPH